MKVQCDMQESNLTKTEYWESLGSKPPRMRLPSSWNVSVLNTKKLLRSYIKSGMQVLEIGCAPGKILAYCAAELQAEVAGIDYSKPGMRYTAQLFDALGLKGDLRCEDVFSHSFQKNTFDLVYSLGVIEHFADPRRVVEIHTQLLKPGGVALVVIPDYGGLYGRLQQYFDYENLAIHNLEIMSTVSLRELLSDNHRYKVRSYPAGNLSPWLVSFHRKWPLPVSRIIGIIANTVGILQPFKIDILCPMLVLEITAR